MTRINYLWFEKTYTIYPDTGIADIVGFKCYLLCDESITKSET